jgi:uncharacterized membrane protein YjjB (DUF3815 family)
MNSIWYYLRDLLACFPAVIGYGIYMSVSKKPLLLSSACGTVAYLAYRLLYVEVGNELLGYLVASLITAVSAEVLARIFKTPSVMLVFPAIIPLVPGVGLYRTMLCLVRNDMQSFPLVFARTLLISGIIAVTVAVVNAAARSLLQPHLPK